MFRSKLKFILMLAIPLTLVQSVGAQDQASYRVYFGTAGNNCGAAEGIYRAKLAQDTGEMGRAKLLLPLTGAGWIALHPKNSDVIYSTGNVNGQPSVVAVSTSTVPAEITSGQPTGDGGACFLTTDQTGQMLISAHYDGGSIAVFPLSADGSIGERSQLLEHAGGSRVIAGRQNSPHPHYVAISPDNRFAFVPDLGLDQLVAYRIDLENKRLLPHLPVSTIAGGGPRHMKFHPNGKYAFVLNELAMSMTIFRYDSENGSMKLLQTVETLSETEKAENQFNSASEIRINSQGTNIYTANRGHDSISVFRFAEASETVERVQLVPVHGSWPRNFNFSPDGKTLIVAGQDTNSISLFEVADEKGGKLRHLEHKSFFVPGPICVAVSTE